MAVGGTYLTGLTTTFAALSIINNNSKNDGNKDNALQKIVNSINEKYESILSDVYLGTSSLDISKIVTEEELGIDEIDKKDSEIVLRVKTADIFEGFVIIQATVTLDGRSERKDFKVEGFLKEADFLEIKANQSLNPLNKQVWTQILKYASTLPNTATSWQSIGLIRPASVYRRFDVEFTKNSVDENLGIANFTIKLSTSMSNNEIFEKTLNFNVHGYFVESDDEMNYVIETLMELEDEYQTSLNNISASSFAIGSTYTLEQVGLENIHPNISEFTSSFIVNQINEEEGLVEGEIKLHYSIDSNSTGKENGRKTTIVGFI